MINTTSHPRCCRFAALALAASLLCGCSMLLPANSPPLTLFSFDGSQQLVQTAPAAPAKMNAPTLIVGVPRAATGFTSPRMVYIRQAHTFEYFSQSQWVDTPANMLSPLIVAALERSGRFSAVIQSPSSAVGDLRLDTEIVRLQHVFLKLPSQVRFTLRAHLIDTTTRQVVGWREFDAIVAAPSDDPYGGVLAANSAAAIVIRDLVTFCGQTAAEFARLRP